MDGSIGDMLCFHAFKRSGLGLDIVHDIRALNEQVHRVCKVGMIILGGSACKHQIANAMLIVHAFPVLTRPRGRSLLWLSLARRRRLRYLNSTFPASSFHAHAATPPRKIQSRLRVSQGTFPCRLLPPPPPLPPSAL